MDIDMESTPSIDKAEIKDRKNFEKWCKTAHEMFISRGYKFIEEKNGSQLLEEIENNAQSSLGVSVCQHQATQSYTCLVFYRESTSVGNICKTINKVIKDFAHNTNICFISKQQLTPSSLKMLVELNNTMDVELFYEWELFFNVTKHSHVPNHQVLSKEDKSI